jgi:hypothetical protein
LLSYTCHIKNILNILVAVYFTSLNLSLYTEKEKKNILGVSYASVVKRIMYTMVCTCQNISYIISVVIENLCKFY